MSQKFEKSPVKGILKFQFGLNKRIAFYKKFSAFTKNQFPMYESLLKFKTRYEKKKDFRAKMLDAWISDIKQGATFHQAVAGWIPDAELNLIQAGEEGPGLEKGLDEAIKFGLSAKKIKNAIISGATYPLVLLLVILAFVAMFSIKMAPTYYKILPVEKWPDMGQYLYYFSSFIVGKWFILASVLGGLGFLISKTLGTWTGSAREIFDKVPPWSVYKVYQGSAFLIALASLVRAQTPLNDALKKLQSVSSKWLGDYINDMLKNLKKGGNNLGVHLDVGLLDEELAMDIIDYSDLGHFEDALYSLGEETLEESVQKIESRMGLIKNLMLVLVGVTVGVIYYTNIQLNTLIADNAGKSTSVVKSK
jgi:type II secretory pathway component PulF